MCQSVWLETAASSYLQSGFPLACAYLKEFLQGTNFSSDVQMKCTVSKWLIIHSKEGIKKKACFSMGKCILKNGDYIEKYSKIFSWMKYESSYCKIQLIYYMNFDTHTHTHTHTHIRTCVRIYIYIYIYMYLLTARGGCDTRSILKWILTSLNSEFSYSQTGCHT